MRPNMTTVGMADLAAVKSPGALNTLGLGSCVGVALYDPHAKVAGLAHYMLPDSRQIQNNSNVAKFADTAIAKLISDMERLGAKRANMVAKIAGGAQMFAFNATNDSLRIGDRNIEAAVKILKQFNIPLKARDVGDNYGRTVEIHADDGRFIIKAVGRGIKTI